MSVHPNIPSFRRFIREWCPEALSRLVDVVDYEVEEATDTCAVRLTVRGKAGEATVRYEDLPAPRPDGSFVVEGVERAVWLAADRADLAQAEIRAVGEQLAAEIEPRLTAPPEAVGESAELLEAWLPLDRWVKDFFRHAPTSQAFEAPNWLARETHLRRLLLPEDDCGAPSSQIGRACPFETPEGPNAGRVLSLARGAEVRDGRLVITDPSPAGALGLGAGMVPLLEHNDPVRQLFGANMMRQWIDLPNPEPALVRSGHEPDHGGAWTGRNLLTAFVPWKGLNYEDGIVVSQSCAARLASPDPLEVGDKLSNRHGTKGVVGAIVPDEEMPHLPDGRPVDLVFDVTGLHTRLNFGQIREVVLGNVAHARGAPVIAPPLAGPSPGEVRALLREAGLPEDGQFRLRDGRDGPSLREPSTVGYVYWGKTVHRARPKLARWFTDGDPSFHGCRQGELEAWALQTCDAYENLLETFGTRSADRPDAGSLAGELARGPVEPIPPPSPGFDRLARLLRTGGIAAAFDGGTVRFAFAEPGPEDVRLAAPLLHPWCPERELTHVGPPDGEEECYRAALAANERAARAPGSLRQRAEADLARAVDALLGGAALREALRPSTQTLFSARAVLAPGPDLTLGEIGLPEEMAWALFEPLVVRAVGAESAAAHSPEARAALERAMAENVVLMNRPPSVMPTSITAFRPVLRPGPAIRLHPLCCRMFNADFDGDQAAILLPVTEAAQAEARADLTVEAHVARDPGALLDHLAPSQAILFGLAYAAETPTEREPLLAAWPPGLPEPPATLTRVWLVNALAERLAVSGPTATLSLLQRLGELGMAAATRSGASLHPFIGSRLSVPPAPTHPYPYAWWAYCATVDAALLAQAEPDSPDLYPQVLLVRSGARGSVGQLRRLVGPRGGPLGGDPFGGPVLGSGLRDGLPPEELFPSALRARAALHGCVTQLADAGQGLREALLPRSEGVLARAMRAADPGPILGLAALHGETDPLTDPTVRLFVGLRPAATAAS